MHFLIDLKVLVNIWKYITNTTSLETKLPWFYALPEPEHRVEIVKFTLTSSSQKFRDIKSIQL